MTCIPEEVDAGRTVLETESVTGSNGWWTGVVRDRDHRTGETRLRLERWVDNGDSYNNPHTWRVRPDFWEEEKSTVTTVERCGGGSPPDNLPLDDRLTALEYTCIRKDDVRWIAIVRIDRPYKDPCWRLYHWDPDDRSVRQKWTIGRHWPRLERLATQHLQPVA